MGKYEIIKSLESLEAELAELDKTIAYVGARFRRARNAYKKDAYQQELLSWQELRDSLSEEISELRASLSTQKNEI